MEELEIIISIIEEDYNKNIIMRILILLNIWEH